MYSNYTNFSSIRIKDTSSEVASLSIITFVHELLGVLTTTGREHLLYRLLSITDLLLFIDVQLSKINDIHTSFCIQLVEIFQKIYTFYSTQVRAYITKGDGPIPEPLPILSPIISIFTSTDDLGLQWACSQSLRTILTLSSPEHLESDEFLGKIYSSSIISELFNPLSMFPDKNVTELHFILLQFLGLFISSHGYRFKYLALNSPILKDYVSGFLILREDASIEDKKTLLATISIIHQIVELNDEFYNRILVKFGRSLLDPLIPLLITLSTKNNLISSSLFNLFELIGCGKDNDFLLSYFNRRFYSKLKMSCFETPIFENMAFFSKLQNEDFEPDEVIDAGQDTLSTPEQDSDVEFLPLKPCSANEACDDPIWSFRKENAQSTQVFRFGDLATSSKKTSRPTDRIDFVSTVNTPDENGDEAAPILNGSDDVEEINSSISPLQIEEKINEFVDETSRSIIGEFISLDSPSSIILSPPKKVKYDEKI